VFMCFVFYVVSLDSINRFVLYNRVGGCLLRPYIKQIHFVFKKIMHYAIKVISGMKIYDV
jgi:hypothetical protein